MEDAEKLASQLEGSSISPPPADHGSRESECSAAEVFTARASEPASTSEAAFVTAAIDLSKCHWSERAEEVCHSTDDAIARDNVQVFQALQRHPTWGHFFRTFGHGTDVSRSSGEMVVGEKFAEGGQAELFRVDIAWRDAQFNEYCEKAGEEWVLKVFKEGTRLRELQSQWPEGYLEWWADQFRREQLGFPLGLRWQCDVKSGTLMRDGRFAFVMARESGDLRSQIDKNMLKRGEGVGPFSKGDAEEIVYRIARGVEWLHKRNVVHRDIKASNVLVTNRSYSIADFECSVGVVGTGFWRAPEILQACKDRTVQQRPELFSKASDVYSLGMTCYEVLTGKYPFQPEGATILEVIQGKRPRVPAFVDAKWKGLLRDCWQPDPGARPSVDEILSSLEAGSKELKKWKVERARAYEGGHALLGCSAPSHGLALVESAGDEGGQYACKLCSEEGNGEAYHCTSCGDFYLHPECARIQRNFKSFVHAHELEIRGPFNDLEYHVCDGCLEVLAGCMWTYRCGTRGCDFDLHARCGKFVETIAHASHAEHRLGLSLNAENAENALDAAASGGDGGASMCEGCKRSVRPKELVYRCKECDFSIHPNCALGRLLDR